MLRDLWLDLRLFFQGALFSYVALFSWLRPMTYLASKVIMPLAQILFFTFLGMYATSPANASFYVIGNAVQIAAVSGIFGVTMSVGGERWAGTLIYLFGAPANRLAMFVGRAFFHVIDGILGVFIGLAWGVLLLGLDLSHTDGWGLLLAVLITTFSTSGLGLLLGCVSLVSLDTMFVNNSAYFLLLVFSGANIPLANLPAWMQAISWGLPLTRGIAAARALIAGSPLAEVAPLLVGEALLGVGYIFLGYVLFRWFEFYARRRGTLESF
jgi:ABC-2 type transport system permease protein